MIISDPINERLSLTIKNFDMEKTVSNIDQFISFAFAVDIDKSIMLHEYFSASFILATDILDDILS